jgi:Flp pilus assembly protein TadD
MSEEAVAELNQAIALSAGSTECLAALGHVYAVGGKKGEAHKVLRPLLERSKQHYVSPYSIALVYAGLGEPDEAFAWLHKSFENRASRLVRLKVDPRFKSLRSDPGFADMVRRIGLKP